MANEQTNEPRNAAPAPPDGAAIELVPPRRKRRRGFAAMSPEKQRAIASLGGKRSHQTGRGHRWDHDAAVAAGRKGGKAASERRRAYLDGTQKRGDADG
ncbi:MAG TPA: KGG domain-containing protein [Gammaproteobacteria bacterium]|nr:KGG domain-containing protein [Gammaproteobacteria bacterium]